METADCPTLYRQIYLSKTIPSFHGYWLVGKKSGIFYFIILHKCRQRGMPVGKFQTIQAIYCSFNRNSINYNQVNYAENKQLFRITTYF